MEEAIRLHIVGDGAVEVSNALGQRLYGLRCSSLVDENPIVEGCTVSIVKDSVDKPAETVEIETDPNDTIDFAVEKLIDLLAEKGVVSLPGAAYTPEDEERIRQRLQNLGYIE